jgi:hypothetical protein
MGAGERRHLRLKTALAGLAIVVIVAALGAVGVASLFDAAPPRDSSLSVLDTSPGAGSRNIVTIGADGLGLIAYLAGGKFDPNSPAGPVWTGTGRLKVAHCSDTPCSGATITTVATDVGLASGFRTASGSGLGQTDIGLAIGQDALPFMTYYRGAGADLMAVHCNDANCSSRTITPIVTAGDVGKFSSAVIGPDGLPVVAFYDATAKALEVARCANVACTSATVEVVDSAGGGDVAAGLSPRIVVGPGGHAGPTIAYLVDRGPTSEEIRVARCGPENPSNIDPRAYDCSAASINPVFECSSGAANLPCGRPDIVVGTDGLPFVTSFFNARHCEDPECTATTAPAIESDAGGNTSPAVGGDGLITYLAVDPQAGPRDPAILHCTDFACSTTIAMFFDDAGPQSHEASLTFGTDGNPLMSIVVGDAGPGQSLGAIHCSNPFCVPFFRRR